MPTLRPPTWSTEMDNAAWLADYDQERGELERLIAHEDEVINRATAARIVALHSRRRYVVKLKALTAGLSK